MQTKRFGQVQSAGHLVGPERELALVLVPAGIDAGWV